MKKYIAKAHLYLGLFFSPLILFYALTGGLQVLRLHARPKDGSYVPPQELVDLSWVHKWQRPTNVSFASENTYVQLFEYLSIGMAFGLVLTGLLGITMAFQRTPRKKIWLPLSVLVLGIALPVVLILLQKSA